MARIDDLVSQVPQADLRRELESAVAALKSRQRFGLVFEEHIPETTALYGLALAVGFRVQRRAAPASSPVFRVTALNGDQATIEPESGGATETVPARDLLVIKRFGEPIYPALRPLGNVRRGADDKPAHAVINGENFDALQLLLYLYEAQVDCIYLDPPYNTGARDWTYNNDYVDRNDTFRHSKWLSFMEKRLKLAQRLLKPDGVLIATIDENEVHHLGMLLERLFPEALQQMVTICINPSGVSGGGLSRVEEYAYFCFLGHAGPVATPDDMFNTLAETSDRNIRWEALMRGGNAWYRSSRKNLCYPIILDKDAKKIVGVGSPLAGEDDERPTTIDGFPVAWPVRLDGRLGIWRVAAARLRELTERGFAYVSSRDEARGTWTIRYLMGGTVDDIDAGLIDVIGTGNSGEALLLPKTSGSALAKTMWRRGRHTAGGAGGTHLLVSLLGKRDLFSFPKSLYAVKDCLSVAVGERRNALILDFFAGSGTTFHAACLLNAEDGGSRRCILVTNNEVKEDQAKVLHKERYYKGDPDFEKHGIFEAVTRPRCEAVVTGHRSDGSTIPGAHIGGRTFAQGFPENVEFYKLEYLDRDEVEMRRQFEAILPALWLTAGGVGAREVPKKGQTFSLPPGGRYGVLFHEAQFRDFREAVAARPDVTHVWLVTDSEEAFAEMRAVLPPRLTVSMLYRDYLRSFQINTERTL